MLPSPWPTSTARSSLSSLARSKSKSSNVLLYFAHAQGFELTVASSSGLIPSFLLRALLPRHGSAALAPPGLPESVPDPPLREPHPSPFSHLFPSPFAASTDAPTARPSPCPSSRPPTHCCLALAAACSHCSCAWPRPSPAAAAALTLVRLYSRPRRPTTRAPCRPARQLPRARLWPLPPPRRSRAHALPCRSCPPLSAPTAPLPRARLLPFIASPHSLLPPFPTLLACYQ